MTSKDIITEELLKGAYIRKDHIGFDVDYKVIHCLVRKYAPHSIFEIGTNTGEGVNVIAGAALPYAKIYSLDLDYASMMENPIEFPIGPNGEDRVGSAAKVAFHQIRGDSMKFDYSSIPCEAYFIDGCHDYDHPFHETKEILKLKPKLIIWHDANIEVVNRAILDNFRDDDSYHLYRVEDCRIAYALKIGI